MIPPRTTAGRIAMWAAMAAIYGIPAVILWWPLLAALFSGVPR